MSKGETVDQGWDPWQALGGLRDVEVVFADPGRGRRGLVDFATRRITLHPHLLQREARSTLAHELIHLERGPATPVGACREEVVVDREASRRLITLGELVSAVKWTDDLHELAHELWVDTRMVLARVGQLLDDERQHLVRVAASRDGDPDATGGMVKE